MLTVTYMKENGKMTKLMEKEHTLMLTEQGIKATGVTTSSTGSALKPGRMVPFTKDSTSKGRKTAREN
jgi:hypothetical protein